MTQPATIYKVATRAQYDASRAAGHFVGAPVDRADGFIHFSTAGQLAETLRRHFVGQSGLVVFSVAAAALGDALRWEPSRGGDLFPHLYGELPMALATRTATVYVPPDGNVVLPEWIA